MKQYLFIFKEAIDIFMDIKDILSIVSAVVLVIAYIVVLIIAVKRKKDKGEPIDVDETFAEIAQKVLPLIKIAEIEYKSVSDKKTGALKLKDVLNDVKDMCAEKNFPYNKQYWTDYIKEGVNLINIEHPEKQVDVSAVKNDNESVQ